GGYSQIVAADMRPDDPSRGPLEQVRKAAERAAALTQQLLAFSRHQMLVPAVVDLNVLLKDMEKMLLRLISEDVQLALSLEPSLWKVKVDPGQMTQVIMNLVVNSRDAMPRGGRMIVETSNVVLDEAYAESHAETRPGQYVQVTVQDTGCGMDEA